MTHNHHRGEVEGIFNGKAYRLVLTLGALAELETSLASGNLLNLADRFSAENLSARDLIILIGAGLRAGGATISDKEVANLTHEAGAVGFATVAANLLNVTFGGGETSQSPKSSQPSLGQT